MTIQNKLFTAITSTFTTNDEIKALKAHLNTMFHKFSGNKLNDGKIDKCFSEFIGAKNTNTISAIMEKNNLPLDEAKRLLKENAAIIFEDHGKNFESFEGTPFCFDIPLMQLKTHHLEEKVVHNFEVIMQVMADYTEDRITILHTLYLYDLDKEDYVEIPQGWDFEQGDFTYIMEDYLEVGELKSKKVSKEIIDLMGFTPTAKFKDNQFVVDASMSIATHISYLLKHLTGHKPTMLYNNMKDSNDSETYHAYELKY